MQVIILQDDAKGCGGEGKGWGGGWLIIYMYGGSISEL